MRNNIYIIVIIVVFLKGNSASASNSIDSTIMNKSIQRINDQISLFQSQNKEYFKQIILNKFKRKISEEYLSELKIVAEPNFSYNPRFLHFIEGDSLKNGFHFPSHMAPIFQYIVDNQNSSIYDYFDKPEIDTDNVMISFRLYDKYGNLTDYLEIYEYRDFDYYNTESKAIKQHPLYRRLHLIDTSNPIINVSKNLYKIPKDINIFSIKNNSLVLYRCVIYDNAIYSIECLQRIYPNVNLEEILKYPKEKTCGCEVNNYLKYVKE